MSEVKLDTSNHQALVYTYKDIQIIILGGVKSDQLDRLKCTLKIVHKEEDYPYRTSIELYHRDQVEKLIREIADYFRLQITDVRGAILDMTNQLENYRLKLTTSSEEPIVIELNETETAEALKYLQQPNLLKKLMADIGKTGIIREEANRLLMYLVFTSRKLNNPLHIYTTGSSGTGKTYLQHKVSQLMPQEDRLEITSLTNNAFYYYSSEELDGKLLLIEDLDGVEAEAMYMIRELQTSKKLSRSITKRDADGNLKTTRKTVEARITVSGTTTKEIYEDNANRAIIIHPDSSTKQSEAIINYQKLHASGKVNTKEQEKYTRLLQNIQRLLQPVKVINPLAETLSLPESIFTPRRVMNIYLGLIETVTYINQYQRKHKRTKEGVVYIESTKEDIAWANLLLKQTLLSKSDDLSPNTRAFFQELKPLVKSEAFTTRQIREKVRIAPPTLTRYIKELVSKEYLQAEGNRFRGYYYILLEDDFNRIQKQIDSFSKSVSHQLITTK